MNVLGVVLAAAAAWVFGAIWYGVIGKKWMEASGLTEESIDRRKPAPYIVSFICTLLVAGMLRHILVMGGIEGVGESVLTGLGLGLFVASPWIVTNVMFAQRDKSLIWMDSAYPTIGMALMGGVLALL
ncbi:MAG: DUF1761 domain-containing protein [Silicimonas sp.]